MGQEGLQVAGEQACQGLSTPLSVKQLKGNCADSGTSRVQATKN